MPKRHNKHRMLRQLMAELDVDQIWLAHKIKRSPSYLTKRMADGEWLLGEMYAIGKILHIPQDKLLLYFPNGGADNLPSLRDEHSAVSQMCDIA